MAETSKDLQVLVTLLRRRRDWSQAEMAKRAGINPSSVSQYEGGEMTPSPAAIQKLAAASGVPLWVVDGILLPALALTRELEVDAPLAADADLASQSSEMPLSPAARLGLARFLAATAGPDESEGDDALLAGIDASPAADPWTLLPPPARATPPVSADLVAEFERLVERVCAESCRAAARDAGWALELARLALNVADLVPGAATVRARPQGFAQGFIANALRAGDDLRAADAAVTASWALWHLGQPGNSQVLGEWRLLDLEASLRRDQRRFDAALDLLDRALAVAPAAARGRMLLNRASTLEQAGDNEASLAVLLECAPLLDAAGEPRDRMGVRFNTIVSLYHLGRYRQAEALLAELRQLVQTLGNDQDLTRFRWLASRVAAGLGRHAEALAGFVAVQRDFRERGKAYDAALVSLDLAVLYLEQGRTREVATLAGQMAWIFSSRDVGREALAALRLFSAAAARESLSLELARRLREDLNRCRRGPRPLAPRRPPRAGSRRLRHRPHPEDT